MHTTRLAVLITAAFAATLLAGCTCPDKSSATTRDQVAVRVVEARANTYAYNRQTNPSIDVDPDGNLLVAWGSRRQERGTFGVFAQRFDALGLRIGDEIHVNQTTDSMQSDPAVAYDWTGNAWIVWQSDFQDGEQGAIVARRFGATGTGEFGPLSDEILVNQTTAGHQLKPTVATNDAGDALIVWTCDHSGRVVLMGRVFSCDGEPVSGEFLLGESEAGRESVPAVAGLPTGRFVAVWARTDADGRPGNLYARRFAADGAPLGSEWVVNDADGGMHVEPAVDADADGRFVVTWMMWCEDSYAVAYRVFDADGTAGGPVRIVAAGPEWRSGTTVAVAPDGRFVISYNVDTPERDAPEQAVQRPAHRAAPAEIQAQCFASDGVPLGEVFRVNDFNEGRQALTIAASGRQALWTQRDQLAFVWTGNTGQDDERGVGLSLLAAGSLDVAVGLKPPIPPVFHPGSVYEPRRPSPPARDEDYGFVGMEATGWNPPDPDLGVGPEHVVLVVNCRIGFFTLDGTQTFSQDINGPSGFWGSVGATSFVFDPIALYDALSGRFMVAAAEHADNGDMAFNLAVSDDSNPNGTWHKYRFVASSCGDFIDFPNLGVGPEAIYLAADFFAGYPGGNWIFVIPKAPTLVGDPVSPTAIQTSGWARSLGNSKTYDADAPAHYFATAYSGSNTKIALEAITDPLGSPTRHTFDLTVPYFEQPPDARQLGTSNRADTIDFRIKNGVYRNGSLWLVHTIGEDSTARVRWYEVEMNGWPGGGQDPSLRQWGTFDYGVGEYNWMSDINADDQGNAIICFSRSSSSQYISVQRAIRQADDPLGTFQDPVTMRESTSPEESNRWGDYAGVDEEPDSPGTFWTHNQYRTSSWRTWVGQVVMPAPPCVGDLDGDGDTDQVDLGILLTDWGCDDPVNGCAGDLDGDDDTDHSDLGILLTDWECGTGP